MPHSRPVTLPRIRGVEAEPLLASFLDPGATGSVVGIVKISVNTGEVVISANQIVWILKWLSPPLLLNSECRARSLRADHRKPARR